MNYNDIYNSFINYTHICEEKIRSSLYTKDDLGNLSSTVNVDIDTLIKHHRLEMIKSKIDHTMRLVNEIIHISERMNLTINLKEVLKVATLYHDIGRFRQATWSNNFGDGMYLITGSIFKNHGEDGYEIFINNDFHVEEKYIPIIGQSILHHLDYQNIDNLNYKYHTNLSKVSIKKIATGSFSLNEQEWQIASLITQLIADIDKVDILYQYLLPNNDFILDYVYDKSYDSLSIISKRWGISKKDILIYNNIIEKDYIPKEIKIPINNIDIKKLEVPKHYKEMFYDNNWSSLRELLHRNDWNFIVAIWWRLSIFLNQIEFYNTLENIYINDLLEKIYNIIPNNIKPLVFEAFNYANLVLIKGKLESNEGRIYLKK